MVFLVLSVYLDAANFCRVAGITGLSASFLRPLTICTRGRRERERERAAREREKERERGERGERRNRRHSCFKR